MLLIERSSRGLIPRFFIFSKIFQNVWINPVWSDEAFGAVLTFCLNQAVKIAKCFLCHVYSELTFVRKWNKMGIEL